MTTAVKSSPPDILPSPLLRNCAGVFAPIIGHMANLSFTRGLFLGTFKTAQVLPLLKAWTRMICKLSTNIQPVDHFKDSGTTGTEQTKITDARVTTLQLAAVRLSPRTLDGDSFAACAQWRLLGS